MRPASGNDNDATSLEYLPEEILVVGGLGRDGRRWEDVFSLNFRKREGSNYGKSLDVVAPVEDLILCYPSEGHVIAGRTRQESLWRKTSLRGTSLAAPTAASLAALIRSLRPNLDAKTVAQMVIQGADDVGRKGWDKDTGHGRLDFHKSLKLAEALPTRE